MNDFLNFSLNNLNLLDNKIHDNIKGTFVDDFIHELQDYLESQTNDKILENLPKPEYYKISDICVDFAVCKNLNTNKSENIPIDEVPKNAKNGDTLLYKNGKFIIK